MLVANRPTFGFDEVQVSLGKVELTVLDAVIKELRAISSSASVKRAKPAQRALEYASTLKIVPSPLGADADDKILRYAKSGGVVVATLDSGLRRRLRAAGVPVIYRRGNRLVVEGM